MSAQLVEVDEFDEVPFDDFIERHPFVTDYTPAVNVKRRTVYPSWLIAIIWLLGVVAVRALVSAVPLIHF